MFSNWRKKGKRDMTGMTRMTAEALADTAPSGGGRKGEYQAIALVSSAHFVNHFQHLVLPPLFPVLKEQLGIGFLELGLALTVASVVGVAAQLPVGYLVDRLGSRRMLVAGLLDRRDRLSVVSAWRRPIRRC